MLLWADNGFAYPAVCIHVQKNYENYDSFFIAPRLACGLLPVPLRLRGRTYTVDASQTSDPGRKVYQTLAELASAGVLAAGDTVILNNDDSSLTSKLPVLVNFRSNDPETPRTVDLSGLGNTPLFSPATGNYTLNMESVVFSNAPARVFFYTNSSSSAPISLKISDNASFTGNYCSDRNSFTGYGYGGVVCLHSYAATALTVGNNAVFTDNHAIGSGGAICVHSYGRAAALTMGNNAGIHRKLRFRQ